MSLYALKSLCRTTSHTYVRIVWSNFEIADLDFFRSNHYRTFFEFLDETGNFYYERWGDAPVHSIAVALFLPKHQIHFFSEIGYHHPPYQHCPEGSTHAEQSCECRFMDNFGERSFKPLFVTRINSPRCRLHTVRYFLSDTKRRFWPSSLQSFLSSKLQRHLLTDILFLYYDNSKLIHARSTLDARFRFQTIICCGPCASTFDWLVISLYGIRVQRKVLYNMQYKIYNIQSKTRGRSMQIVERYR